MERRIVRPGLSLNAVLEHRPSTARTFPENKVLNLLQPVKPDTARFTIEGEGANIWNTEQGSLQERTEPLRTQRAPV